MGDWLKSWAHYIDSVSDAAWIHPSSCLTRTTTTLDSQAAMMQLGNWLGAQQAMEDTFDVLEQEGWMA